ncbi:MAG: M20/M25/M40 family metallo-hydrolase, partial [Verrucomicrobia bacterium]|nr:M20/M25/M40 family metallo-hydrolase [Verrucomicrobiota bacterium]
WRVHYVGGATTEKVPRAVLISSKGSSGHGSRPRLDNAIVKLCKAVATIGEWQPPMRLNDTTRQFFQRLATVSPPEEAFLYANLENPAVSDMIQKKLRAENIGYNSMLRTSISPNMVRGGFRVNVIPADGLATLDVRWLPDEDVGAFVETLRRLVNDPAIDITLAEEGSRKPAAPSRLDNAMWAAIETAQSKVFPGSITLPMMLTGATDSAQLRERGVQAYGIGPMVSEEDTLTVHGNDERVHIEGLGKFLQFLWATVMTVSGS